MTRKQSHLPGRRLHVPLATMIIVASILLSSCAPSLHLDNPSLETCLAQLQPPSDDVSGIFVQPDDGYDPVLDEIDAARCTIDLNIYMLTADEIFDALFRAEDRGVQVRVLLDRHPFGMFGDQQEAFERLLERDVEVKWSPSRFQFSHAKFLVVDGQVALIMNQNLTGAAFSSNREFGVITTSEEEVQQAAEIFQADWTDSGDANVDGPLLVSPDNAREGLLSLIESAEESIDMYAELIRDDEIMAALERAVARGVQVRLIMNASLDPEDEASLAQLSAAGIDVRLTRVIYIHSKTMIIDGDRAVVGSINYSQTSLDRNREVAMVVEDPRLLARIAPVFEYDWVRAVPLEGPALFFPSRPLDMIGVNAYSVRTVPWAGE